MCLPSNVPWIFDWRFLFIVIIAVIIAKCFSDGYFFNRLIWFASRQFQLYWLLNEIRHLIVVFFSSIELMLTLGACGFPNPIDTFDMTGGGGQTKSSASDDSMHKRTNDCIESLSVFFSICLVLLLKYLPLVLCSNECVFYLSIYVRLCDHKPMPNRFGRYSILYDVCFDCSYCLMNCHCCNDEGRANGNENEIGNGTVISRDVCGHNDFDACPSFHHDYDDVCLNESITGQIKHLGLSFYFAFIPLWNENSSPFDYKNQHSLCALCPKCEQLS